jgi:YD repeat-containing protein
MVDSVGVTEWTYNDIGRLTSTDDPWDFTHALTYNAEGFITQMTCEGDTRSYAWNSAGQMTSATRDSKITTFDYNDASWINGINGANDVDTDYTYNSRGWMTDIEVEDTTTTPATTLLDLDYVYDANGNITSEDVGDETWTYTYDALNRLTNVNKPGTADDIVYTYDVRGNRTDIDVGGTDNTDLTFNIADRLTRVDYEDNSYRIYTHDDNGNCTKEEFYSGQYLASPVVVPTDENQTKEELLEQNEEQQAKRKHYPFTHAPKELLRTKYLSPYLPETTDEDFYLNSMLDWTNPALANLKRAERWRPDRNTGNSRNTATSTTGISNPLSPNYTFPADEETHYEYDQANRLTTAGLPDGTMVLFRYDGIGRRVEKTIIETSPSQTTVTTLKYHYIGGQLTTIEIDAIDIDTSQSPPVDTPIEDETIHIHLGPNSQPISFEWVRYDYTEEETLDDTYWFHYDIHGNVLKVTDVDGDVVITYEYDTLGELVSESNPDDIPNPFKWGGVSQLLHDEEIDMYTNQAGSYKADTGTLLGGGGAVFTNPTSGNVLRKIAMSNVSSAQNSTMSGGGLLEFFKINKNWFVGLGAIITATELAAVWGPTIADWIWQEVNDFKAKGFDINHIIKITTSVTINSEGMKNLINSHGDKTLKHQQGKKKGNDIEGRKRITANAWRYGDIKDVNGNMIDASDFFHKCRDNAVELAIALINNNSIGTENAIGLGDDDTPWGDLSGIIFDIQCQYDSDHGGANAHCATSAGRDGFFKALVTQLVRWDMTIPSTRWFVKDFEDTYGKLSDSDGDGIPDVADKNSDKSTDDWEGNPECTDDWKDLNDIEGLNSMPGDGKPPGYGLPGMDEEYDSIDASFKSLPGGYQNSTKYIVKPDGTLEFIGGPKYLGRPPVRNPIYRRPVRRGNR